MISVANLSEQLYLFSVWKVVGENTQIKVFQNSIEPRGTILRFISAARRALMVNFQRAFSRFVIDKTDVGLLSSGDTLPEAYLPFYSTLV